MGIEYLKTWHWVIIGLLMGTLLWGSHHLFGSQFDTTDYESVSQSEFERLLLDRTTDSRAIPYFSQMRIYPPSAPSPFAMPKDDKRQTTWVFGVRAQLAGGTLNVKGRQQYPPRINFIPFRYEARVPYTPLLSKTQTQSNGVTDAKLPSIEDYLKKVKAAHPEAGFTWSSPFWQKPSIQAVYWIGLTTLIIGGVWPLLLRLLVGAGLANQRPEPKYDLNRFSHEPDRAAASAAPTIGAPIEDHLAALERELEQRLRDEPAAAPAAAAAVAKPTVDIAPERLVSVAKDEKMPVPVADTNKPRDYTGEFYPVAKNKNE